MSKNGILRVLTWGYQNRKPSDLRALVERENVGVVVDVRFNPSSRRQEWRKEGLEESFGDRYTWIGWFGLKDWQSGGRELVNRQAGVAELRQVLQETGADTILLLCYEAKAGRCHRSDVAELIQSEMGDRLAVSVEHLGGRGGR